MPQVREKAHHQAANLALLGQRRRRKGCFRLRASMRGRIDLDEDDITEDRMTGMDVLRRCRAYDKDMERLKLRQLCARDIMTKATRSAAVIGHGEQADKMSEYMARVDAAARARDARAEMYQMELDEAARLIAGLAPGQGAAIHYHMIRGLTLRQTAAEMRMEESSVRGLYRRARGNMERARSGLDAEETYKRLEAIYRESA